MSLQHIITLLKLDGLLGSFLLLGVLLGCGTPSAKRPDDSGQKIPLLIEYLGHDLPRERSWAEAQLLELGDRALPFVKAALKSPDAEVRSRAGRLYRRAMGSRLQLVIDPRVTVDDYDRLVVRCRLRNPTEVTFVVSKAILHRREQVEHSLVPQDLDEENWKRYVYFSSPVDILPISESSLMILMPGQTADLGNLRISIRGRKGRYRLTCRYDFTRKEYKPERFKSEKVYRLYSSADEVESAPSNSVLVNLGKE